MEFIKRENKKKNLIKVKTKLRNTWNWKFVPLHFVVIHVSYLSHADLSKKRFTSNLLTVWKVSINSSKLHSSSYFHFSFSVSLPMT